MCPKMPFCLTALGNMLAVLACTAAASGSWRAWTRVDANSTKIHEDLAMYALMNRTTGRYYDTLLHIVDVYKKVGPGTKYRIQFTTTKTKCPVSQTKFSKKRCQPKGKYADNLCIIIVYQSPGGAVRRVESFLCKH
ncbi:mialostatin-like [Amblyomma americanum]